MADTKLIPLNFSITINANAETVWHKMLDLETYKIWTAEFVKTSYYEGSWDLGQTILFTSDQGGGLVGKITQNEYLKVVEITYQSWLTQNNKADNSEESKSFEGATEKYSFTKLSEGSTKLDIDIQTLPSFTEISNLWPTALEKLKEICEE